MISSIIIKHFKMDLDASCMTTTKDIDESKLILPEGKYMGKSIHEIFEIDTDYIVFLAGRGLNFKQQLKYK